MQIAVGSICEGKVTGITKFGAFIDLGDGKTGMVHISEVAQNYVSEIKDHLEINQTVKVKVIGISDDGKINLSIKKALPKTEAQKQEGFSRDDSKGERKQHYSKPNGGNNNHKSERRPRNFQPASSQTGRDIDSFEFSQGRRRENLSFEDMMNKFKQSSEDKMSDLKKTLDVKRGSANRKSRPQ